MRDYVLLSDSTADLPVELVKELGVQIIPFTYTINDTVYYYYLDGERDEDILGFYEKIKKGAMPSTSQVNPALYKEEMEKIILSGKDILYLAFTSGLSGSYQTALLAVDMILEEHPDANIKVVDTLCASVGQGVFLYQVAERKKQGMDLDTLYAWTEEHKTKVSHWFMVEDLFHLKRGGRVSTVEAMVGSALKIKPILSVDEEGKLIVKSKARGVNKALDYLHDKAVEEGGDLSKLVAVIGHAASIEKAEKLKAMMMDSGMQECNIFVANIGPIIGTHVGPGMTAIAFLRP